MRFLQRLLDVWLFGDVSRGIGPFKKIEPVHDLDKSDRRHFYGGKKVMVYLLRGCEKKSLDVRTPRAASASFKVVFEYIFKLIYGPDAESVAHKRFGE